MASIKKRGKTYSVVYRYKDPDGTEHQKWEGGLTYQQATKRRAEVDLQKSDGTFINPSCTTVSDLMKDFVELYGKTNWGLSQYANQTRLISNYIIPAIGDMKIQSINKRDIDILIRTLKKTHRKLSNGTYHRTEFITDKTIISIIKLLNCAFNQAVRWDLIRRNPVTGANVPKVKTKERATWGVEDMMNAFNSCKDDTLLIAMHLSFACTLRIAELCGLKWEDVHISEKDIAAGNAYLYVHQELERISKTAMDALDRKDVYYVFDPVIKSSSQCTTALVLKHPKEDKSVRKVWIPSTVVSILKDYREHQDRLKDYLGDEYQDYGFVIALYNGRPFESKVLEKKFRRFQEKNQLPRVDFHSLRHLSTTVKLRISGGDIKSVQGDTGHATPSMVTEVYSHIRDEDRKYNASVFQQEVYDNPVLRKLWSPPEQQQELTDNEKILEVLKNNPELLTQLASLLK